MLLLLLSNQQPTTQIVYSGVVGGAPIGVLPVGSLSVSAVSVAAINANLAGTLADATAVAVANSTNAAISANLAATLGSVTLVATARPFANAVLGVTLGNLVVQSSAAVPTSVNGNLSTTLGQLTVSATATTPIEGQLNSVLNPVVSSSSAEVVASATLSSVLGQTTLASSIGTVTPNNASVNATLGQLTVQSASNVRSFGTLSTTLSPALLNSTANVVVRAQLNRSLESTRLFATSTVYNDPPRFATLNSTLGSLTSVITTKVEPFDPFKLLNFFDVELLTQIDAFTTEIEISPEYLAAFDTVNYRYALILTDGLSDPEIVWVLGKTNKLFVLRGQEGSVARNWLAGTRVVNGLTAESLSAAAVVGGGGSGDGSALNAAVASAVAASASASASAAIAISSAASASASATSASSSASLTISLAAAASVSADNAASSASASFTGAVNASSSATAAAASATASQTSRLAAEATTVTALGYMNGAELAATGAAVSSANATIAKNDAVTAKTGALTAEASAISAKDLAVAAKVASETAAGNSLSSAGASASSATAASASATSSQSSATASETSRLAAEAAQTGANTSAANAEIARVDAVTAKTDAQAASASATTSASLSATSATSAGNSATAAATSASSASTSATSAGSSASSATTSANTASVQAGNAAASATAAATSAALADSLTGALAIRTTTLEAQMANTSDSGLRARISTEEVARASADTALATRATTLEAQIANTSGSGLQSRIATEESARASGDTALATRATTLEAQMANTSGSGLQSRISTEESARASADAAQASQITTLTAQANGNPNLFPYPTPIANRTPSQLGWIGTPITSTFSSGVGGLVYYKARPSGGSAVNEAYQFDLPETMTFSTGQQFTFSCYGYAGSATVGDRVYAFLDFRSADNMTSLYISPTMTLNSGGTRTSVTGTFPGSFTTGRLRVIFIREWPSSGSYQDVVFNMLKVECGPTMTAFTNSAQVIVQSNAIATLNDSAAFYQILVAASGGDPAIVRLFSGLGGSEVSIAAKIISLINTSSGVSMPVMRATGGEAFFSRPISSDFGTRRVTLGPGYGVSGSEVVLWFGPSTIAPASQSRTNCIFALGTDGNVYYGGLNLQVGGMWATLNLYDVNLTRSGAGATVQSMTATGYAPGTITYFWELISGDVVNIGNPAAATTNIGHSLTLGQTKTSVVRCTMTSSVGPTTFRLLNISSSEIS